MTSLRRCVLNNSAQQADHVTGSAQGEKKASQILAFPFHKYGHSCSDCECYVVYCTLLVHVVLLKLMPKVGWTLNSMLPMDVSRVRVFTSLSADR